HRRELSAGERQPLGVGDLEPEVVDPLGQFTRLPDHLQRQINAYDGGGGRSRAPRRRARPAPDVEQAVVGGKLQRLERRSLLRVAPPRGDPRLVGSRTPVEPAPSGVLGFVHASESRQPTTFAEPQNWTYRRPRRNPRRWISAGLKADRRVAWMPTMAGDGR